jgi:DNA-binding response OmpR family regulator
MESESPSFLRKSVMKPVILITNGSAELCRIWCYFLAKRGYEAETAADALDCLAKLRRLKPAVLVLDLDLRWGGSGGVLACLREDSQMPWVPVVLTAAAGSTELPSELLQPPVVQCLHKPFSLTALLESVHSTRSMPCARSSLVFR